MIRVNLVPQEILDKEAQKQRAIQAGVVAGFLALAVIGLSLAHFYRARGLARQLQENEAKLEKLQRIVAQVEEFERMASLVRTRLNVIVDLLKSRPLYPRFMEEFIRALPGGAWVTNLSTQMDGGGLRLSLSIKALSSEDVTALLRTMEDSPVFKDPSIGAINVSSEGGAKTYSFSMNVRYAPRPAEGQP